MVIFESCNTRGSLRALRTAMLQDRDALEPDHPNVDVAERKNER